MKFTKRERTTRKDVRKRLNEWKSSATALQFHLLPGIISVLLLKSAVTGIFLVFSFSFAVPTYFLPYLLRKRKCFRNAAQPRGSAKHRHVRLRRCQQLPSILREGKIKTKRENTRRNEKENKRKKTLPVSSSGSSFLQLSLRFLLFQFIVAFSSTFVYLSDFRQLQSLSPISLAHYQPTVESSMSHPLKIRSRNAVKY